MKRILLFGAPGSGKGTIADMIVAEFSYLKISTGDLIREEIKRKTPLGLKVQKVIESGDLVADAMMIDLVKQRLARETVLAAYILDGFPRTLPQAMSLQQLTVSDELVLALEVAEQTVVDRLISRLTCTGCGAIYNLNGKQPVREGICDICGAAVNRRPDDLPETIRQRIRIYLESTAPVIDYYEKQKKLIRIEAEGTPAEVYQRTRKWLS